MSKAFDAIVAAHDQAHGQGAYPLQLFSHAGLHVAVLLAGSPGGNGVFEGARRVPTQPGEALTLRGKETEAQGGEIVVTVDTKPSVPVRPELLPRGVRDLLDRTNESVGVEPRNSLDGEADLGEPGLRLESGSFDSGRYGGGVLRSHDEPKGAERIAAVDRVREPCGQPGDRSGASERDSGQAFHVEPLTNERELGVDLAASPAVGSVRRLCHGAVVSRPG